ncbi:MAG TPA: NUDIX hydrolase [Steroidobacteraceae bacterium]|jgi:ADP-ribose pyrophosphatase YjhB (NUDIX family)
MNFCSHCGQPVTLRVPPGDHLPRFVCDSCGTIHYQNPKLVAGCIPEWQGKLLICRRAIEPRRGFWTVPAGFMENDETLMQAAAREAVEEAEAIVQIGSLLAIFHALRAHQVHVFFRARLIEPRFGVGPESLEVKLIETSDIPWDEIAFPSSIFALRHYLADRAAGREDLHITDSANMTRDLPA